MAKDKKAAKEMTMEEKLAQALVSVEEQPYKIPENWCWVYLTGGFAECLDSFRKPINATERVSRNGDIPYYGATGQVGWINDFLTDEQLVLVGEDGAPFLDLLKDKAYIIKGKAWVNNHAHVLRSYFGNIGNYYLLHYLNCFDYTNYVNGTTRLKLTQANMNRIPVPLSPLKEQGRIVDRIESIFSKLDEAKEKAQAVVDGFELRKSAILHKAFTGELTKQWRADRGISLDNWKKKKLIEVLVDKPRNGYSPKPVDYKTSCKSMTLSATTSGYFREECFKYIDEKIDVSSYLWLKPGDILIQRANSLDKVGTSAVFTGKEHEFIYPDLMMKLQVKKEEVSSQFIAYQIKTDQILQYLRKNATGTAGNMPKINQKVVSSIPIICPSIEEQNLIVKYIEKLLSKEQQSKKLAETVINQIDVMKKAVLARAFRGELGTNDLTEEAAIEVLKLILQKE